MKETKPYLLTLVAVFFLISVGLLVTTIYLYFNSGPTSTVAFSNEKKRAVETVNNTKDSLTKIYATTIKNLDAAFAVIPAGYSNNSERGIKDTSAALQKLRNEINILLADTNSAPDLTSARVKIDELQLVVTDLKNKNTLIKKENERLLNMLEEDTYTPKKKEIEDINPAEERNRTKKKKGLFFRADNIQVMANNSTELIEKETTKAIETDKLICSFTLKNNNTQNTALDIIVVVVQPDGKVLQSSNWETGVFYTSSGKQIYSKKLRLNNNDEVKKLSFSLEAEKYLPGKYTIVVYYEGAEIGRAIKVLS